MKKTALLAVALATCLGYVPAQAAEVVSSNIVGYQKITLTAGYQMIGVQFTQVGGTAKDIGTVGTCDATMAGFDEDGNYPTEMRVWNGLGYDYYGWAGTSGTDVADEPSLDNQWLDFNTMEPSTQKLPYGTAVWIKAEKAGTITFSAPSAN